MPWWPTGCGARDSGTEVRMLAARRVDIDELNRLARSELRSAGRLVDDIAATGAAGASPWPTR